MSVKKVLILCGGWDGHQPELITKRFGAFLEQNGFQVDVERSLGVLQDLPRLKTYHLIVPVWTMCKEALDKPFFEPVAEAIGGGVGLAGCHGGMCDAFRNNVLWQFITGANWVAHPGCDGVTHHICINKASSSPLTAGIDDFDVSTEQYYLQTDAANDVLATTRFPVVKWYHSANGEVDVPQVWTRRWGYGRVFYNALGHHDDVFDQAPAAWEMMKRGLLWAAEGKTLAEEKGLTADDWKNTVGMY